MTSKTIISCAVTGNIVTRDHHPRLPVTPAEIAQAALDAASAGASIAHIHVREPDTGKPSMRVDLYAEVVERIRARNRDLIINLTTGEGGRFTPSEHDPKEAAPGSTLTLPENRVAHVVAIRPDMCSLDFNTMNSGSNVVINTPTNVRKMANAIVAAGVMPEIEVFDSGDIHMARDLIDEGTLPGPHLFQIVTGVKYGASSTGATLLYLKSLLPLECQWSAFGLGRMEFPMVAQAFLLGGHVRVGFEDNVYISKGRLARDNAELVEKCASILHMLGGDVASPQEARSMLGLRPQN
ncbi:3-keto-5-aminohexanoate cleavage protein [Burkholderia dolosa]|jgi:uncharacterized protein (DUF849 family)|uniref:3-keto-5-aminohexanoate cleavage protein n=1 Tax=Burkholderia dolosa TaxID=152500 RepID=UPI001590B5F8|nr:3-keto-5-aminohexanoate cleavage protein [Burkholderia dolosa]MBR8302387.1 3-keto-5-aminohexanoate cleavage protein [Burkholderia dolosa]